MKVGNLEVDYSEMLKYTTDIFNYLNGKVNTVVLASRIEFGVTTMFEVDKYSRVLLARNKVNVIIMYLSEILFYCDEQGMHDMNKVRAMLLHTVVHELSHCDQDIDYNMLASNDKYNEDIENSNDANSLLYIADHYDELQMKFGPFNMETVHILKPFRNIQLDKTLYRKVIHPIVKFLRYLSYVMDDDMEMILRAYSNAFINYTALDGGCINRQIMVDRIWLTPYENITFLQNALSNNDLLAVRSIINGDTYTIYMQQRECNPTYPMQGILNYNHMIRVR